MDEIYKQSILPSENHYDRIKLYLLKTRKVWFKIMKKARSITSPMKFYINKGLFKNLPEYTDSVGRVPYIIADPFILEDTKNIVGPSYDQSLIEEFGGENSQSEIDKHVNRFKESKAEFIIGIGGGKTLDNAKAIGDVVSVPVVIIPTLASTDAPATSLSVQYKEDGSFEKYLFLPRSPEIVIMDLDIIANSPASTFAAGMADGLATWIEGRTSFKTDGDNLTNYRASYSGYGIAEFCYNTIIHYGVQALEAVKNNLVSNALGRVVEATTWMSGVGAEAVGLTASHAIHNGMTSLPYLKAQHGEIVAFANICTMILEGFPDEEIIEMAKFHQKIELPLTLEDMGVDEFNEEDWRKVAELAVSDEDTMSNMAIEVTADDVYQTIQMANILLNKVKANQI